MGKEKRKSTTVCLLAAALILGCYLVQTTDCLRLTKTEKLAARNQSKVASKTIVQEGNIVFGKVVEEGPRVTDETTKASSNASVEDATSYQADFAGWTQPEIDDADKEKWNRMATSLHCYKDHMKFRSLGPGASQLSVEQANQPPMPLSMVPSKCGYKMQGNSMGFIMMVPYDGCNMIQRGDNYMLPLRWHGNPVSLVCPKRARKFYNHWPQDSQVPQYPQGTQAPQMPQVPQYPQGTQAPQVPQYPQVTQAPQMPQVPQYPQIPQFLQYPQIPPFLQYLQMAQLPQAPQYPQAPQAPQYPQAPQAPQYPQAPQAPQYPQAPQAPQYPQAPQAPQVPNEPQVTQDSQDQYLSYLYSYPFFSYLFTLAAEQSTNSPSPSYPQQPFSYPVLTTTEPPTTSAPKVPSFPRVPFNPYFPWPVGQLPDFSSFFPPPVPEYPNPTPESSKNPTPGYPEYPSPTPEYPQYPKNPTPDVQMTAAPTATQNTPAAAPQFYPPEYLPFLPRGQDIPYWLFPFQG